MSSGTPDEVRKQQADLRQEIRNLGKRKRRLDRGQVGQADLEPKDLPTPALMVFVLADYNAAVAVDYLRGKGRSKRSYLEERSHDDIVAWVETACIETPDATLRDLLDEPAAGCAPTATKCKRKNLTQAGRYVLEHALFQWTVKQNLVHGVAPSRDLLVTHALSIIPESLPRLVRVKLSHPLRSSARTQRKWLWSFRRRWGARVGGLPARKHLPQELIHSKVRSLVRSYVSLPAWHIARIAKNPLVSVAFGSPGHCVLPLGEPCTGLNSR